MRKLVATREAFGEALVRLAQERKDIVVLDADISKSLCTDKFAEKFPHRHFNFGVAEQNMMTVAAGLATTRKTVFACTYAVFATMRACEEVRTFIAYPDLNVKIAAGNGGLHTGADGVTHQGIEDIGIMRSIPNMTIVVPADAVATERAMEAIIDYPGPVYLRLGRNKIPVMYDENYEFALGKAVCLRYGDDVAILATGVMVSKALEAADILAQEDVKATVVDVHTIKPIDVDTIVEVARRTRAIVTAEDHNIIGGLGSAVAEVISEHCSTRLKRIGLRDIFGESGDPDELLTTYGLGVDDIVRGAKEVLSRASLTGSQARA